MKRAIAAIVLSAMPLVSSGKESVIFFTYDSNSLSATGEWIPADPKDKPAFPAETQIDCFRKALSCVEATAEYYYGHPHVTLNYLDVIRWDKNGLIATSSAAICMTNTMLVSFAEKSITITNSMKELDDKTKGACNFFGAKNTEGYIFVLRGSERWNKEHDIP
jgi:hypothetical protein